jgi:hypothetical protein
MKAVKYTGKPVIETKPMAQLRSLTAKELIEEAKKAVQTADRAKRENADFKATVTAFAKVVAALTAVFNAEAANGKSLVSTMTFPQYFSEMTKGKLSTHVQSVAKAYGAYVDNGLIAEKDYDNCPSDWLEKAASVLTAVELDLTHDCVFKVAGILKDRPKDGAKQLQAILEDLKGPKEITVEKAREMLALIFANNLLDLTLATVAAEITDPRYADRRPHIMGHLGAMMQSMTGAPAQKRDEKPKMVTPEIWARENLTMLGEQDMKAVAVDVETYVRENSGKYPENADAFFAWSEAKAEVPVTQ